jgi:ribosome-binding protein aMBF1 (putative translation factor)
MNEQKPRRITRPLTPDELEKLRQRRQAIAQELPDLHARDQMRKEAREEPTLSGEVRRAIHASPWSLTQLATRVGVTPTVLDEFLTGERTLRSDVLDRLAIELALELTSRA